MQNYGASTVLYLGLFTGSIYANLASWYISQQPIKLEKKPRTEEVTGTREPKSTMTISPNYICVSRRRDQTQDTTKVYTTHWSTKTQLRKMNFLVILTGISKCQLIGERYKHLQA